MRRALQRTCGVSYQAVSQWFTGETSNIKNEHLAEIAKKYGSSLDWLISGMGSMIADQSHTNTQPKRSETILGTHIDALMASATPRSQSALERIAEAAANGDLSEADLIMLEQIATRFQKAGIGPDRSGDKIKDLLQSE